MTREEQTDWLCRLRTDLNNGVIFTPWNKEFTEALTGVLEQEPVFSPLCQDCNTKMDEIRRAYDKLQEPSGDAISRKIISAFLSGLISDETERKKALEYINELPPVNPTKTGHWIPVSERLPEDLEPVNITWVNHEPEPYYHDIKDRNFVATGIYYRGQWYWYSTTCADYLGEYGSNEIDKVDDAVEIIAWMPLPKPYEPQERNDKTGIRTASRLVDEVLDKIRAEIEGLTYYWCEVHPRSVIDDVLQVIDKYRGEQEDADSN